MIKELMDRWKAETPVFWKKVGKYAISVALFSAGLAGTIWELNKTTGLQLSGVIIDICKYLMVMGATIRFTSQFTKTDKP